MEWLHLWRRTSFFANMDKRTVVGIAKRYKRAVVTAIGPAKVYLFGAYSKGCARPDSDIDIAVVVERMSDDYFEDTPLLWKLKRKTSNLIEPVLLTEDTNNPLYADILKTGLLI